ncbi:MAG: hypothetical protein LC772_06880 [Chloroflexi bacterium]|nr:hypothetical protein [Chloroflexota bacterium]
MKAKLTFQERVQQVIDEYATCEVITVPNRVVRIFHPRRPQSDYLVLFGAAGPMCSCEAYARSGFQNCKHTQAVVLRDAGLSAEALASPVAEPVAAPPHVLSQDLRDLIAPENW